MDRVLSCGNDRKIMVAIDEGEYSHYALMWALDNLKESLESSKLVIFMAQPPPAKGDVFAASLSSARVHCPVSATPQYVNSAKENNKKLTLALLEKAKEICAGRGVHAEIATEAGHPTTAICDAVKKYDITLLILGERGLGKIKRALLGSVSNYCLQYATCPVLVAKKPQ